MRFLSEPCPCGSSLRRLGKVHGRMAGRVRLFEGGILTLSEMDEVLFKIPDLLNYRAELTLRDGKDCLSIQVHTVLDASPEILEEIEIHLMKIPAVKRAMSKCRLLLDPISVSPSDWPTTGTIKRILVDKRREHGATLSI